MWNKIKNNEGLRFIAAGAMCFLGVISGIGALNWGVEHGALFNIAGIVGIILSAFPFIAEYKRTHKEE